MHNRKDEKKNCRQIILTRKPLLTSVHSAEIYHKISLPIKYTQKPIHPIELNLTVLHTAAMLLIYEWIVYIIII